MSHPSFVGRSTSCSTHSNRASAGATSVRFPGHLGLGFSSEAIKMEGVYGKGVSQNCIYEVSTSKIPSTRLCEGFCLLHG